MSINYELHPRSFIEHSNGNSFDIKAPEITFCRDYINLSGDAIAQLHYHFKEKISPEYFHIKNNLQSFGLSFSANIVLIDGDGKESNRLKVSILDNDTGKFKVQTDGEVIKILVGAFLINNLNTIIEEVDNDQDIPVECGRLGRYEFSYHIELAEPKSSEIEWDID
jgi:hypothetical protein